MCALNNHVQEGGSGSELGRTGAEGAEGPVSDRKCPAPAGRAASIRATRLRFRRGATRRTGVIWAEGRSRRSRRAEMAILSAENGQLIRFDRLRRSKLGRSGPLPSSQNGAKIAERAQKDQFDGATSGPSPGAAAPPTAKRTSSGVICPGTAGASRMPARPPSVLAGVVPVSIPGAGGMIAADADGLTGAET